MEKSGPSTKNKAILELDPEVEKEVERQYEILRFGCVEITPEDEFKQMLRHSISGNKPLRVKCGIDPTGSDVHLGHTVPYRKMRQFQDLGHLGVVIIGDYTASIGDPTGKVESRPALSAEQVKQNAKKYMDQIYTVLNPDRTELAFQSEWFNEVTLRDVLTWAANTTVAKLLSHETFRERLDQGHMLGLHELFYPVLQGVDSVYVKADVELGGSDQKFNVLMGRDYQRQNAMRPQVAMLLPIITGTCGTQKMSKSLGNYIGILDGPFDKFGKIMSIPDALMPEYYKLLGNMNAREFDQVQRSLADGSLHPNIAKKNLGEIIVSQFHGADVAREMREKFESIFKNKEIPEDAPEFTFAAGNKLIDVLVDSQTLDSRGEVRRMAKQNAISIEGVGKISDVEMCLSADHDQKVIKVGKRKFLKLRLK